MTVAGLTLQRRLMLYLLICAPLVWALATALSVSRARHEVNELFDTELIRLARQVQAVLGAPRPAASSPLPLPQLGPTAGDTGEADVHDLSVAVWDSAGGLMLADREGVALPYRPQAVGFVNEPLAGEPWRIYYLQSDHGQWLVAAGQKQDERDELVTNLIVGQLLPWVGMLPLLLVAMTWAVRRALAPLNRLTGDVQSRDANDLQPIVAPDSPAELRPLLQAMNRLFARIDDSRARERRFTADAAHELRTPLAALRAQWDVLRGSQQPEERARAERQLAGGLDRMDRLVTQLLALSQIEAIDLDRTKAVDWAAAVEQAVSDALPLATRRRIEMGCEWPADGVAPLPVQGDTHLLTVLLRNLLDNAMRYAPEGTEVLLRFEADRFTVENDGPGLSPEDRERLGERFRRRDGQAESGSGLGVSIVLRIATLHRLTVAYGPRDDGRGVCVTVRRAA